MIQIVCIPWLHFTIINIRLFNKRSELILRSAVVPLEMRVHVSVGTFRGGFRVLFHDGWEVGSLQMIFIRFVHNDKKGWTLVPSGPFHGKRLPWSDLRVRVAGLPASARLDGRCFKQGTGGRLKPIVRLCGGYQQEHLQRHGTLSSTKVSEHSRNMKSKSEMVMLGCTCAGVKPAGVKSDAIREAHPAGVQRAVRLHVPWRPTYRHWQARACLS